MKKIILGLFILLYFLNYTFSYSVSDEIKSKTNIIINSITTSKKARELSYLLRYKTMNRLDLTSRQKNILNFVQKELFLRYEELLVLEKNKKSVEIFAGGDVMISRYVGFLAQKKGRDYLLKEINPIEGFENSITFYNLESPFSKIPKDTNQLVGTFGANTEGIEFLKNIIGKNNQGVLSLANNHSLDSGIDGYFLTKKILSENNISFIGDKEIEFLKITKNTKNICFDGYSYSGDNNFYKKIDEENILKSINNMKKNNCDLVIISLHWGREYFYTPTKDQEELAKKIIDNGGDIILGHHSHVPGKVDFYKKGLIIYSLGNFVFDQNWGLDNCYDYYECYYDDNLKKYTTPTYIGTLKNIKIDFVGDYKNISIIETQKHKINYGKLEKYEL